MLELLKTEYVFQSPDLAFLKRWDVCCVGSGMASVHVYMCVLRRIGDQRLGFFSFHPSRVDPGSRNGLYPVSMLFLPFICYLC